MKNLKKAVGGLIPYPLILAGRKALHIGPRRCEVCDALFRNRLDSGYGYPVLEQLQVVGGMIRRADRCPICHSSSRERLIWFYLTKVHAPYRQTGLRIAHFAPEKGLSQRFRAQHPASYRAYDFAPNRYRHLDAVAFQNLEELTLDTGSVDLLVCNHVMEHVYDLSKSLSEVRRVLAREGLAIMQVPISLRLERMRDGGQDKPPEERIAYYGQDDHVRLFTAEDYKAALNAAGLSVAIFDPFEERSEEATLWELDPMETLFLIRPAPAAH